MSNCGSADSNQPIRILRRPSPQAVEAVPKEVPKARKPTKTFEEREANYAEARLRILGSAYPDTDEDIDEEQADSAGFLSEIAKKAAASAIAASAPSATSGQAKSPTTGELPNGFTKPPTIMVHPRQLTALSNLKESPSISKQQDANSQSGSSLQITDEEDSQQKCKCRQLDCPACIVKGDEEDLTTEATGVQSELSLQADNKVQQNTDSVDCASTVTDFVTSLDGTKCDDDTAAKVDVTNQLDNELLNTSS